MVSMPCTNAARTSSSSGAEPKLPGDRDPPATPPRTAAAADAGRPCTDSPARYPLLITVPRTATPIVAPTWRSAEISAAPDPLRSADSAPSAMFIADGIANPRPSPAMATQASVYPVELPIVVNAPIAIAAAITR